MSISQRRIWFVGADEGDAKFRAAFEDQLSILGWVPKSYVTDSFAPEEPADPETSGTDDSPYGHLQQALDDKRQALGAGPSIIVIMDTRSFFPTREWVETKARGTPIVTAVSHNPDVRGVANTLDSPGKGITGVVVKSGPLVRRRLKLLSDTVSTRELAVLHMPHRSGIEDVELSDVETAAAELGFRITDDLETPTMRLIKPALDGLANQGKALYMVSHPVLTYHLKTLAQLAHANKLPCAFPSRLYAEAGGLLSCGPDPVWMVRRAAMYVQDILDSRTDPSEIPMRAPNTDQVVVNKTVSADYGITIPQSVLEQADIVI